MNGKRVKLIGIIEDFQKYPENICINGSIEKDSGSWIGENQVMFKLSENFKLDEDLDKDKIGEIVEKFINLMVNKCKL